MNSPIRLTFLPLTLVFFLYLNVGAQNFEGKITSKNISINIFALDEFIYGNEEYEEDVYEENYDEGESDFNEYQIPIEIMEKYFALSIIEIEQAVDKYKSEFGDDYIEAPFYTEAISEILIKGTKMRTDSKEGEMKISFIMDMNDPIARMIRWDQKVVINMNL